MEKIPFKEYLKRNSYSDFDLKAVLFDMDGVLYDSMKWHAKSWKQMFDEYHINTTEQEFYLYEGMVGTSTIADIVQRENYSVDEDKIMEMYNRKSVLFAQMNDGALIPFAVDLVKKVAAHHLTSVIVTGSGQYSLLDNVSKNFGDIFTKDKMVTAYDVTHGKPHPEPYLKGLRKAGSLSPNQAIVVENAPRGVEAAVAAGIFTIAINTGPLDPQVLYDSGADIVLPSMQALFENFDKYLNIMNEK